jgi:hypothetical protein
MWSHALAAAARRKLLSLGNVGKRTRQLGDLRETVIKLLSSDVSQEILFAALHLLCLQNMVVLCGAFPPNIFLANEEV